MPSPDPIRGLLRAAVLAAGHIAPGVHPERVIVLGREGKLLDMAIVGMGAHTIMESVRAVPEPDVESGWSERNGRLFFDGAAVPVSGRKADLLRLLLERETATVDQLRPAWQGSIVEEGTIRWTVGELKKTLAKVFPDFPGEIITSSGNGYSLQIR